MRLSDNLVLQQVDDTNLVLVNDSTGQEFVFKCDPAVFTDYLSQDGPAVQVGPIEVPPGDRPIFSFALGYFWMSVSKNAIGD